MDVIITAIGEFIWASSCTIVNFCLSSGLSTLLVFVSFLCGILALAFYKYTISRERMLFDDIDKSTIKPSMRSSSSLIETTNTIENEENNEQIFNNMIIYNTEDSEEEVQMKQIKDIYHLLNDNNLTVTDFIDQLKLYGLQINDEIELELS